MVLTMPKKDATSRTPATVTTTPVKLLTTTVHGLSDIAEAKGLPLWQVVEELLAAQLPAAVAAIQPQLKKIREQKKKIADLQAETRRKQEHGD